MIESLTQNLREGNHLSQQEVEHAAELLLSDDASVDARADFLKALREKGETPEEITYFVEAFLGKAVDPEIDLKDLPGPSIDVCGTGGDKLDLFNVSTTSMFVLAAGGVSVIKHGNRGITSKSGGADVLEALGIRIDLTPPNLEKMSPGNGRCFYLCAALSSRVQGHRGSEEKTRRRRDFHHFQHAGTLVESGTPGTPVDWRIRR